MKVLSSLNKLSVLIGVTVIALATLLFTPHVVRASAACTINGQPGVQVSVGVNGSQCLPLGNSPNTNPIIVFLKDLLKVITGLVGLAAVGGVLWGAMLYITARANSGQVEKAKIVIINAIIGILLFVFLFAILQFLVPGGVF